MLHRSMLYLIAGWSGFYVMGIELLGGRLLAPYFGSSIYVWGAVITVFMLALSLGYLCGGRVSLGRATLRRLALILFAAALATVPVLVFGGPLLERLSLGLQDPRYGSLIGATLLFFLPTFVSGMIAPYAVRLVVPDRVSSGHHAGKLYFISTFGSAAGTLLTSFYLVLYLEVDQILLLMLAISVAVSAVTWLAAPRVEA